MVNTYANYEYTSTSQNCFTFKLATFSTVHCKMGNCYCHSQPLTGLATLNIANCGMDDCLILHIALSLTTSPDKKHWAP